MILTPVSKKALLSGGGGGGESVDCLLPLRKPSRALPAQDQDLLPAKGTACISPGSTTSVRPLLCTRRSKESSLLHDQTELSPGAGWQGPRSLLPNNGQEGAGGL